MKKFFTMALVVLALGFASCANRSNSTETVQEVDTTEVVVDSVSVDSPVVDSIVETEVAE